MKNIIYLLSFLFVFSLNAQKNKNGTVYDEHPGIELINSFEGTINAFSLLVGITFL